MKTLLTLLGVVAASATAHAGTINYDFRGDLQNYSYNDAAGLPGYTRFYIKTGRLDFKGNLNDRISYQLRWGFYKPALDAISTTSNTATGLGTGSPSNSKRDSLNSSVEYAFVTDKMSDLFALSLGKVNTEIGGFEGATSGADLYLVSPYYQHTAVKSLDGKTVGINQSGPANILYMTGAKGDFSFADQHVYVMFLNNIADATDAATPANFNQNRGLAGVTWKGTFAEKTYTGLLSYHEVSPQGATTDSGNKHTFMSAGIKYESTWAGSLEYNATEYKDGATGNKDQLYAAILKLGYKMDEWTPRLELFTAEEKVGTLTTVGTNKFMGYGAVLEYKPTAENFRYHVAVNSVTSSPYASASASPAARSDADQTRMEVVVGARLLGDFLK